jgi:hypothetical protein
MVESVENPHQALDQATSPAGVIDLDQQIWGRYGHSPGLLSLTDASGPVMRISRLSQDRLPILNSVQRRLSSVPRLHTGYSTLPYVRPSAPAIDRSGTATAVSQPAMTGATRVQRAPAGMPVVSARPLPSDGADPQRLPTPSIRQHKGGSVIQSRVKAQQHAPDPRQPALQRQVHSAGLAFQSQLAATRPANAPGAPGFTWKPPTGGTKPPSDQPLHSLTPTVVPKRAVRQVQRATSAPPVQPVALRHETNLPGSATPARSQTDRSAVQAAPLPLVEAARSSVGNVQRAQEPASLSSQLRQPSTPAPVPQRAIQRLQRAASAHPMQPAAVQAAREMTLVQRNELKASSAAAVKAPVDKALIPQRPQRVVSTALAAPGTVERSQAVAALPVARTQMPLVQTARPNTGGSALRSGGEAIVMPMVTSTPSSKGPLLQAQPETALSSGGGRAVAGPSAQPTSGPGVPEEIQQQMEVDELVDRVLRKLIQQLAVESERRGWQRWP